MLAPNRRRRVHGRLAAAAEAPPEGGWLLELWREGVDGPARSTSPGDSAARALVDSLDETGTQFLVRQIMDEFREGVTTDGD